MKVITLSLFTPYWNWLEIIRKNLDIIWNFNTKAQFKRRTFHLPNVKPTWVDQNYKGSTVNSNVKVYYSRNQSGFYDVQWSSMLASQNKL